MFEAVFVLIQVQAVGLGHAETWLKFGARWPARVCLEGISGRQPRVELTQIPSNREHDALKGTLRGAGRCSDCGLWYIPDYYIPYATLPDYSSQYLTIPYFFIPHSIL